MSEQFDSKISRLAKRYKGLARFVSAANDLYIYGIFESNFPKLMDDINDKLLKKENEGTVVELMRLLALKEFLLGFDYDCKKGSQQF